MRDSVDRSLVTTTPWPTTRRYRRHEVEVVDAFVHNVHPTSETLDRLQMGGAKGFRYDENGDVMSDLRRT